MILTDDCKREQIVGFLMNRLDIDEKLECLEHVQGCNQGWSEIYNARKSEHPHYYKRTTRQVKLSDSELKKIDAASREDENSPAFQLA